MRFANVSIALTSAFILISFTIFPRDVSAQTATDVLCTGCVGTADLANSAVTALKIINNAVTTGKISNGTIINEDISSTAAISASKINDGTGSMLDADLLDGLDSSVFLRNDQSGTLAGGLTLQSANINLDSGYGLVWGDAAEAEYIKRVNGSDALVFGTQNTDRLSIDASGNVGIGTTNPSVPLQVTADNGVLFTGTVGSGSISTIGSGTRLMWYPAKAAFRVGYVGDTQWDDGVVGLYSFASGAHTTASGEGTTSMGYGGTASGEYATSIGYNNVASGNSSVALGETSDATGYISTAIGNNVTASSNYAVALGNNTTASGDSSVSLGYFNTASGSYATTFGYNNTASAQAALAAGQANTASNAFGVALGAGNVASGDYSAAIGGFTEASGSRSVAMGNETVASGDGAVALNVDAVASGDGAFAAGQLTEASGDKAAAFGYRTTAPSYGSFVIGRYNENPASYYDSTWDSDDPVFVIGNGSSSSRLSNAFVIYKSGEIEVTGDITSDGEICIGSGC